MAHAIINFPKDAVTLKDGQPVTTSLKVAEVFKKEHTKVLRSIKDLVCSEEFNRANFGATSYLDTQNRKQPMFEMTKDGFTFLVMGFTGPEAARYKEDYIRAFNMMLEKLQAPQKLPEPRATIAVDVMEYENMKLRLELAELKLMNRTRKNWKPEELSQLIFLTQQGIKPTAIGERLDRSPDSVETKQRELRKKGRI